VSHVHLPVQSGSDRVLCAMKRGYTALEYKSIIRRLRAGRPDAAISSDFIVGFPGETDQDFEQTLQLVEDIGFEPSFSFMYSPRPGTPAASLPGQVPQATKQARLARLQSRLDAQALAISSRMVGSIQRILVEGPAKKNPGELAGRTSSNLMVNFRGPQRLIGRMTDIRITTAMSHSLRGEMPVTEAV
jgi:tRNA-2-methylthio-N6-dimethylallyladenosine synthase